MRQTPGFGTLFSFEIFISGIISFSIIFSSLFFYKMGFSYAEILAGYPIWFLTAALSVKFLGKANPMTLMRSGLLILFGQCTLMFFMDEHFYVLLYWFMIHGIFLTFYCTAFNTLYFRMGEEDSTAFHSSILFMVFPLMNIFMPYIGGLIISKFGFRFLYMITAGIIILFLHSTSAVRFSGLIDFSFSKIKDAVSRVRPLIFLEGFWQGVDWTCVPLITFDFFSTGKSYGTFLSYLGFAGALAAILLSRISDKARERRLFAYSSIILLSLATCLSYFTRTREGWIIIRGLVAFSIAIVRPFSTSVLLDHVQKAKKVMVSREMYLNLGRAIGSIMVLLIYVKTGSLYISLLISGLVFALYPILVERNGIYPERFSISSLIAKTREYLTS